MSESMYFPTEPSVHAKAHGWDLPIEERIERSLERLKRGQWQMRIPADATDPDLALGACRETIDRLRDQLRRARKLLIDAGSYLVTSTALSPAQYPLRDIDAFLRETADEGKEDDRG